VCRFDYLHFLTEVWDFTNTSTDIKNLILSDLVNSNNGNILPVEENVVPDIVNSINAEIPQTLDISSKAIIDEIRTIKTVCEKQINEVYSTYNLVNAKKANFALYVCRNVLFRTYATSNSLFNSTTNPQILTKWVEVLTSTELNHLEFLHSRIGYYIIDCNKEGFITDSSYRLNGTLIKNIDDFKKAFRVERESARGHISPICSKLGLSITRNKSSDPDFDTFID
jgi:hypothetical protein